MRSFLVFVSVVFLVCSCEGDRFRGKKPVAEAGGKYLYQEDIKDIFSAEISEEDSLAMTANYIRSWAIDILMYEQAQQNIKNKEEIASLLEKYRRSLLVYEYQLQLVKERLNNNISPEEISSFYSKNPQFFSLKEVLIRGALLKVPIKAPDVEILRSLMLNPKERDLDHIESLSIKNSAKLEYDGKWHSLTDIKRRSSIRIDNPKQNAFYESRDGEYAYFLFVKEYLPEGALQPLEHAESKARGILLEQKKNNFLKQFGNKLYEDALNKGKVKIYE